MTLKKLAEYLNVPQAKLAHYLRANERNGIRARKVHGRWEISLETVQDWLLAVYEEQLARETALSLPRVNSTFRERRKTISRRAGSQKRRQRLWPAGSK